MPEQSSSLSSVEIERDKKGAYKFRVKVYSDGGNSEGAIDLTREITLAQVRKLEKELKKLGEEKD